MTEKTKGKTKKNTTDKTRCMDNKNGNWKSCQRGEKISRKRVLRWGKIDDLEVALVAKKHEAHVLGKAYVRLKLVEKLSALFKKFTKKTAIFGIKTTYRSMVIAVAIAMVYAANPFALSAPQSTTITFKNDWDKGTLASVSTESSQDAIQLKPTGT